MCKMYLVSIEIVNWFENTLIIGGEKKLSTLHNNY
jgi:hypothetical protein